MTTRLRHDVPCQVPALGALRKSDLKVAETIAIQIGGQPCHLDIVFDDGTTYHASFKLVNDPTLAHARVTEYIFLSEVTSIHDLTRTKVIASKDFIIRANDEENEVGLTFLLMEKLPEETPHRYSASSVQTSEIIKQIADVYPETEQHPYKRSGSPFVVDESLARKLARLHGYGNR